VGRFSAVSGWRYDGRKKRRGPKPVRRVAPAGSVYFFRVEDGELTEDTIRRLWLAPLSDEPSDRKDGYGLAQPGVWTDSEGGNT
jgi:CRISPR-associated protein Cmr3